MTQLLTMELNMHNAEGVGRECRQWGQADAAGMWCSDEDRGISTDNVNHDVWKN
jgi:hypothetical protein